MNELVAHLSVESAVLIDTNLIVHAHDPSNLLKMRRARDILAALQPANGCLSPQILGEFYRVVTGKLTPPMSRETAAAQVENLALAFPVLQITSAVSIAAARMASARGFSYWDAQVWATALVHQVPVVASEDFGAVGFIEGVRFVNPFADVPA